MIRAFVGLGVLVGLPSILARVVSTAKILVVTTFGSSN
jgi:hypothetical protein